MTQGHRDAIKASPNGMLVALLIRCFTDAAALCAFIRSTPTLDRISHELPRDSTSLAEMADAVARHLCAHGLVTRDLFDALAQARPGRASELWRVAEAWGVARGLCASPPSPSVHHYPSPIATQSLSIGVLLAAAVASLCYGCPDPVQPGPSPAPLGLEYVADDFATGLLGTTGALALDAPSPESLSLRVVSVRMGKNWQVSLSPYRTAESAARDIFLALHLKGDREVFGMFAAEKFLLCQDGRCYDDALIVSVIDVSRPVHVKKLGSADPGRGQAGCLGCH